MPWWEYGAITVAVETSNPTGNPSMADLSLRVSSRRGNVPAFETTPPKNQLEYYLEEAGREGWELAGMSGTFTSGSRLLLVFKKPHK
jgi:hypothetical protein